MTRETQAAMQAAIEAHIDSDDTAGVLGDWLLVACTVGLDQQGETMAQYHMAFSGGEMLDHQALGLVRKAEWMLENDDSFRPGD
jgi:hypothetical protein